MDSFDNGHGTDFDQEPYSWSDVIYYNRHLIYKGLIALVAASLIGLLIWSFIPHATWITVIGRTWSRSVDIQIYTTVYESDWYIPSGGRMISSSRRVMYYEEVLDHYEYETVSGYEDVLVGYDEEGWPMYESQYYSYTEEYPVYRDEPVWGTWYDYEIEKWIYSRSVESSGVDDDPYWEPYNLEDNERTYKRYEYYYLYYNDGGNEKSFSVSYDEYMEYVSGTRLDVIANQWGITSIEGIRSSGFGGGRRIQ